MMVATGFTSVGQRIPGDVGNVIVGQGVDGFFASPGTRDQAGAPEHPQVLRGKGLRDVEDVHHLVDAPRTLGQLEHDGEPIGRAQRSQELARVAERGRLGTRRFDRTYHYMNRLATVHDYG